MRRLENERRKRSLGRKEGRMKLSIFMAALVPMIVFGNVLMWGDIVWLRGLLIYWQVVSWGCCFYILNKLNDSLRD